MWVRQLFLDRKSKGEFHLLVKDLRLFDSEYFWKYYRMTNIQYEELLHWVAPYITKSSQKREAIGPSERLSAALKYLVTGDMQTTIATAYRLSPSVMGRILRETCPVIWDVLLEKGYLKAPSSPSEWKTIAKDFEQRWQFNHCIGAIDGKHVAMQAPANSGSMFFNYKKSHSIVLMGICDANYKFILVDIGDTGRNSDGGVLANSQIDSVITDQERLPKEEIIPGTNQVFPYVFVGDDAFPLRTNLLKPYPREILFRNERIYNYRCSRARRIIENCFGILASRFRILRRPIVAKVETVVDITKAVVALHNYLMSFQDVGTTSNRYCPPGYTDVETMQGSRPGDWRKEVRGDSGLFPISRQGSNNYSKNAKEVRDQFRDFFVSPVGQVSWQWEMFT